MAIKWTISMTIRVIARRANHSGWSGSTDAPAKVSAMTKHDLEAFDMAMMRRCVALAESREFKEGNTRLQLSSDDEANSFCELLNMVRNDRDVTRHAEMVAISSAQKKLGVNEP